MAFPRLDEVKELWRTLPAKINAIGDYFEAAMATLAGKVAKSITTDEDGKAQLVNDLADGELVPDLVYGTDSEGARGYKPDYGGRIGETPVDTETAPTDGQVPIFSESAGKYVPGASPSDSGKVGTKTVDETAIADGRILAYSSSSGKIVYVEDEVGEAELGKVGTKEVDETDLGDQKIPVYDEASDTFVFVDLPTGSGSGAGFLVLPYLIWRTAFGSTFMGLIDVQMQISTDPTFAASDYDLDSATVAADWRAFSGASGQYAAWEAAGMPATDVTGIAYTGEFEFDAEERYYMRWRVYEHGTTNYGDWIPGGVL